MLALDLRGHGQSGHKPPYGEAVYADDILALVEALQLDRPILVGHSMGGGIVLRAAGELGDRVRALVLVDTGLGKRNLWLEAWWRLRLVFGFPPVDPPQPGADRAVRVFSQPHEWRESFSVRPGPTIAAPELIEDLADHAVRRQPDGSYAWSVDPKLRHPLQRPKTFAKLSAIRCPVFLIHGEKSFVAKRFDPELGRSYFPRAERVQLDCIAGAYHHVFLDCPEAFVRLLTDRLASVVDTPG